MSEPNGVEESDPSADSGDGLAGDLGTSSERVGPLRGAPDGTYGAAPVLADDEDADPPPEQSADPATGEARPDTDLPKHDFDRDRNPGH